MRVASGVALLALAAACATPDEVARPSDTPSTTGTTVVAATTTSSTSTTSTTTTTVPVETTTTTAPHREIVIRGTGKVYSLEESQAFGEFGPLLWNLVTTIHHKDAIEHHPGHLWVIWGPLWGGRLYDPTRPHDVYGITDLDAADPAEVAGAIPMGKMIILREVPWALDDLNRWSSAILEFFADQPDDDRVLCGFDRRNDGLGFDVTLAVHGSSDFDAAMLAAGMPADAVFYEFLDECPPPPPGLWP